MDELRDIARKLRRDARSRLRFGPAEKRLGGWKIALSYGAFGHLYDGEVQQFISRYVGEAMGEAVRDGRPMPDHSTLWHLTATWKRYFAATDADRDQLSALHVALEIPESRRIGDRLEGRASTHWLWYDPETA